jgi:glutamine---fructose-6-phosphate transaminase (isomerizing)
MCGIFGIVTAKGSRFDSRTISDTLIRLATLSESRGKESAGFCFLDDKQKELHILRGPVPASKVIESAQFKGAMKQVLPRAEETASARDDSACFAAIGHARLVTNGTQLEDHNNQPVMKDGIVGVHNGIIVNVDSLWQKYPGLRREYTIDTEVMLSIFRHHLEGSKSIGSAATHTFGNICGTVATAMMFQDMPKVVVATNNGSLYTLTNSADILLFASERYILERVAENERFRAAIGGYVIDHVKPNSGCIIDLAHFRIEPFSIGPESNSRGSADLNGTRAAFSFRLSHVPQKGRNGQKSSLVDLDEIAGNAKSATQKSLLDFNPDEISTLKRCSKCLLPETFPFIEFDDAGVCNICGNYVKKNQPQLLAAMMDLVEPYRSRNGRPDCIVPYSGGRDSSFVVHVLKTKLGMNPIAYTYDWGMVTDLARRNIARVCGKLGIENIVVSADIAWKRENIRKNITAWLRNPNLGMIPLFMAGDKYFFYYCNQVKKQTGINLNIWGINALENTDFKTGFAGLMPRFDKKRIYSLDFSSQMKLFYFVGKNIVRSPGYVNQSLADTFGSFLVRYLYPKKDYYHFFDYYQWNEREIEETLFSEYDWEKAIDTKSTWRIGDGTASFYNYVYHTVAGFTENDTFRSNQIREGLISREEGLRLISEENRPRYETIRWYLDIVGLDYDSTIKRINKIPKLYRQR